MAQTRTTSMRKIKQFILRMALSLCNWAIDAAINSEASQKVINDLFLTANPGILHHRVAIYLVKKGKLKFYYLKTIVVGEEKKLRYRLDRHMNPEQYPELPVIEIDWITKSKFTDQVKETSVYEQNKKTVRKGEIAAKKMKCENDRAEKLQRKQLSFRKRVLRVFFPKSSVGIKAKVR